MVEGSRRPNLPALALWLLAALSLAAGGTHFSVVGEHWHEHLAYGLFFMVLAWFQVLWALAVLLRPARRWYVIGAVVNALVIAVYVVSRTSGLPLGPEAWEPEAAAAVDIVCTVFELLLVVLAVALAVRSDAVGERGLPAGRVGLAAVAALVLVVAVASSASLASSGGEEMVMKDAAGAAATPPTTAGMGGMQGMGGRQGMDGGSMDPVDPTWHYTGPALPSGTAALLQTVFHETEAGHAMQDPHCTASPTAAQQQAALSLVQRTTAAVAKYQELKAALAAGYVPVTSPTYPMVHYVNPAYLASSAVLDPNHVESLVYDRLPSGQEVLVAAMYMTPRPGDEGPTPGGCLTQWHAHTNLCRSLASHLIVGFAPCPSGTVQRPTAEMLHVWQVPVPGGPLAMDPTDLQVMESAIMATTGITP